MSPSSPMSPPRKTSSSSSSKKRRDVAATGAASAGPGAPLLPTAISSVSATSVAAVVAAGLGELDIEFGHASGEQECGGVCIELSLASGLTCPVHALENQLLRLLPAAHRSLAYKQDFCRVAPLVCFRGHTASGGASSPKPPRATRVARNIYLFFFFSPFCFWKGAKPQILESLRPKIYQPKKKRGGVQNGEKESKRNVKTHKGRR